MADTILNDNNVDDHVDGKIADCLALERLQSFFLFAGAGSGKTRSLITVLEGVCKKSGNDLKVKGKKIGVITYTNAACDEIKRRLNFNPLLDVSTIHSFVWSLIHGYNQDIRAWMKTELENDIRELEIAQARGRASKASTDRAKSIVSKTKKLEILHTIKVFVYNPNGDNKGRASLTHSDVIKIGSDFLNSKPLMRTLLINKYPILLIDESQDTNKNLMDALLNVQSANKGKFALGLLGDTMQRIYSDGKIDLGQNLPEDWAKPVKVMNHRCPKRIVELINKISSAVGGQQQRARSDSRQGLVRMFIADRNADKPTIEKEATASMSKITSDSNWDNQDQIKTLILEHHMAAKRLGFELMFEPLYKLTSIRTGLLDGSLPELKLFWDKVLPIVEANGRNDNFAITAILRKHSPLLSKEAFSQKLADQTVLIKKAKEALAKLLALFSENKNPSFLSVLDTIAETNLFEIPESLKIIAFRTKEDKAEAEKELELSDFESEEEFAEGSESETLEEKMMAWDLFLQTSFSQIKLYSQYVLGEASFDTHQGVKGLEFPRVMVIIDDTETRGFLFKYDKLFGTVAKSTTDIKNEESNADTSENRTRRLFYVTCSRAEESLAIVAYTDAAALLKQNLIGQGWFTEEEIIQF